MMFIGTETLIPPRLCLLHQSKISKVSSQGASMHSSSARHEQYKHRAQQEPSKHAAPHTASQQPQRKALQATRKRFPSAFGQGARVVDARTSGLGSVQGAQEAEQGVRARAQARPRSKWEKNVRRLEDKFTKQAIADELATKAKLAAMKKLLHNEEVRSVCRCIMRR